ncbi:MAG TPA: hypothetical protein GX738_02760 [Firmicutes bacterium]|nr:hypothetical protein [Bacillota bacterium]
MIPAVLLASVATIPPNDVCDANDDGNDDGDDGDDGDGGAVFSLWSPPFYVSQSRSCADCRIA